MLLKASLRDITPYSAGKSFPDKVKLSSNENPLGPSPGAVKAIEAVLGGLHRYPDGASTMLRDKIANIHGLTREEVAVGNGSDELFALICGALLDTGDLGLISENTFSEYRFSLKLFGATVESCPLKEGCYDLRGLAAKVKAETKILFLCNPNNPTGTYFNHRELDNFLSALPSHVVVVLDEAYQDYVDAPDYPRALELIKKYPRLMVTRTFSKIYGLAGLRIGYALGQEELIRSMLTAKQAFNVNLLSQAAGAAALDDQQFHNSSREMTLEGKKQLYKGLDDLAIQYYPTQSNFICLSLGIPAEELYQQILDRGLIIRSLKSFGMDRHIRYTISSKEDNQRFLDILKELKSC
ncbi:MAG: histidinol-phosphate transaminase [Spirochaetaceae bacterium]|jgi:histidinol-phosphate aminotransferase|nr:histidinol-phosphate transaminase [Spirochaetaceae bacterium]